MVSIIIPVYGVEDYIEECLASVAAQTYTGPLECIIVDDCSTDSSMQRVARFIDAYSGPVHFRTVRRKHNGGLSAARNTGTDIARGRWLWYVDSDDILPPDALRTLTDAATALPDTQLVVGLHEILIDGRKTPFATNDRAILTATGAEAVRSLLIDNRHNIHSVWTKLVRRDALGTLRFSPRMLCEDIEWNFRLLAHIHAAVFVRDIVYTYRVRPQSIMTDTRKTRARNSDIILSLLRCARLVSHPKPAPQIRWILHNILDRDTELRHRNGDVPPAADRLLRAAMQTVRHLRRRTSLLREPALWTALFLLDAELRSGITMSHPLFWPLHRASKMFCYLFKP